MHATFAALQLFVERSFPTKYENHFTSKSSHFVSFMLDFSSSDPKFEQFRLKRRRPLKEPAGSANSQSSS